MNILEGLDISLLFRIVNRGKIFSGKSFITTSRILGKSLACSHKNAYTKWATSRENLPSGFPPKRVSKQSPQLQRLARKLKFHL